MQCYVFLIRNDYAATFANYIFWYVTETCVKIGKHLFPFKFS